MDLIQQTIDNSWYKYNPTLTAVCIKVGDELNTRIFPPNNKCWLFMQILHDIELKHKIGLPYYWYKDGIVVDPETLMLVTRGVIKFKWEETCKGCQIEKECPCIGSPHNNDYTTIEAKLKTLV